MSNEEPHRMVVVPTTTNHPPPSTTTTAKTSATPTPPPQPPTTTSSMSIGGEQQQVPFQMIPAGAHFFANPFMNPYLSGGGGSGGDGVTAPTLGAGNQQQQQAAAPLSMPMISPAQYQEMMQHYFQQMMAASGAQFPIPFPMQFQHQHQHQPSSQFQQQQPTFQRPTSQCSSTSQKLDDEKAAGRNLISSPPPPPPSSASVSQETATTTTPSILTDVIQETSTSTGDDVIKLNDDAPIDDGLTAATSSTPDVDLLNDNGKMEVVTKKETSSPDEKRKMSGDRTDCLIRKQMSEIEKEISRRSQNKNIKKMNDNELAELIGTTASSSFATFGDASALAYSSSSSSQEKATTTTPKESLNQLRSSFNLTDDGAVAPMMMSSSSSSSSSNATHPTTFTANSSAIFVPSAPSGFGVTMPQQSMYSTTPSFAPNFVAPNTNPFAAAAVLSQFQATPNGSGVTSSATDQLATVFAQQQLVEQEFVSGGGGGGGGIAPPPPPSHPVPRRIGGWLDENKENGSMSSGGGGGGGGVISSNPPAPPPPSTSSLSTTPSTNGGSVGVNGSGDDPVWVLRDSYLKKMQREQRQSEEEEMSWHEAATAAQEAANGNEDDQEQETDRLLNGATTTTKTISAAATSGGGDRRGSVEKKKNSKETMVHEPAVLIEGVLFRARYLGSTQMLCESRGSKAARMAQAQEAVARVKAPEGDVQPSTEIDLFISTEKIMVLNTDLQRISDTDVRQDILMDHALRTISYIADIGDLVVLMARRMSTSHSDESCSDSEGGSGGGGGGGGGGVRKAPKVICHVFESDEASFIAQSIGQAFQVAYVEFLRANGIDDPSYLRQIDYQEVLNSQELLGDELEMFAKKETQKEVVVSKKAGEPLGIVVVESGWGSMLPTVVLAHMNPIGPAAHSNKLNIGDQIISINGISLVGLPLSAAQTQIKNAKTATAVRMTVVSTPPVVEVRIRRPDTKYQLGFSVQNGVICSLLRGGIAERGGIRVGHRIIEINGTSVVAVAHDRIVNMLATAIGEIHMKTMPTSMFRLLTGQEQPQYI